MKGPVLVGPDEVRDGLWVVGGRITYERPAAEVTASVDGWTLPGLVDAHCHVGLDAHGAVDAATAEKQALTDRDAGALLLRDAGSPERHPLGGRPRGPAEDHPRRPAHRPHPALHPQLRPRDRARRPDGVRPPGGAGRRRVGEAGGGLDRPGGRRPRRLLAEGRAGRGDRRRPRGGRPRHRALLRRGLPRRPGARRDRLRRARHRADRRHRPALRRARRRDRARRWSTSPPSRGSRRTARPSSRAGPTT